LFCFARFVSFVLFVCKFVFFYNIFYVKFYLKFLFYFIPFISTMNIQIKNKIKYNKFKKKKITSKILY
jgi:hypothetical protein